MTFRGGRITGHKITRLQPEGIFFPPTGLRIFVLLWRKPQRLDVKITAVLRIFLEEVEEVEEVSSISFSKFSV